MDTDFNYKPNGASYVEWSTIIGGAVVAAAISIVLLQFASAVGIANLESVRTDYEITRQRLIVAGVIVLVIQVLSSVLGGYIAGRMRAPVSGATPHESEVRDGAHGLLVWATFTIGIVIATSVGAALADLGVEATSAEVEKAQDILNRENNIAIWLAFAAGATSLVSAVASWAAAVKGGDHRDRQVDFSRHISFRNTSV